MLSARACVSHRVRCYCCRWGALQTPLLSCAFRRALEQDRVFVAWGDRATDSGEAEPEALWAVFNTGLVTRSHKQLFVRLQPFSPDVVADDLQTADGVLAANASGDALGPRYCGVVCSWRPDGYGHVRITGVVAQPAKQPSTASTDADAAAGGADTATAGTDTPRAQAVEGVGSGAGVATDNDARTGAGGGRATADAKQPRRRPPPVETQPNRINRLVFVHRSQIRVVGGALPVLMPGHHVEFYVGLNPVASGKECCLSVTGKNGAAVPGGTACFVLAAWWPGLTCFHRRVCQLRVLTATVLCQPKLRRGRGGPG